MLGTFNAPGAAINHYVCADSATCGLILGVGLVFLGADDIPGFTTLYHGTDAESVADILANGFNMDTAAQYGGGDALWTTTSASDAGWFAVANPSGGAPAMLQIQVPDSMIDSLIENGQLTIEGGVYKFSPGAMNTLNNGAIISPVPVNP